MKKLFFIVSALFIFAACQKNIEDLAQEEAMLKGAAKCTKIQSGEIFTTTGEVIETGFMENGYNYQAHLYNGEWEPGWQLVMKWSDSWLSNEDCDGDGLLDRHKGYDTYIGSGAWCTNHWTRTYINEAGEECIYDEFIKIIAVPEDATLVDGIWYNNEGVEIGPMIWSQFAIIQEIINDPCEGVEGVSYKSPDHPGLGNW